MPARKRPIQPSKGKAQAAEVGGKKKKKEQGKNYRIDCISFSCLPHFF